MLFDGERAEEDADDLKASKFDLAAFDKHLGARALRADALVLNTVYVSKSRISTLREAPNAWRGVWRVACGVAAIITVSLRRAGERKKTAQQWWDDGAEVSSTLKQV